MAPSPSGPQAGGDYLSLQDLSKVYLTRDGPVRALEQVSLRAPR
jgi:hypothetical protein